METNSQCCIKIIAEVCTESSDAQVTTCRAGVAVTPQGMLWLGWLLVVVVSAALGHGPAQLPRSAEHLAPPSVFVPIL